MSDILNQAAQAAQTEEEPIQYNQIPVFGKLGKILVDSAPQGSGKNAMAFSPVQVSSSSFSSPTALPTGSDNGGGGGGGGGGGSGDGGRGDVLDGFGALEIEICIDGVVETYEILARRPAPAE